MFTGENFTITWKWSICPFIKILFITYHIVYELLIINYNFLYLYNKYVIHISNLMYESALYDKNILKLGIWESCY